MIYKLSVLYEKADDAKGEYVWRYRLGEDVFDTYEELKEYIATLEETSVITYQVPCSIFRDDEPLRREEDRKDLDTFCKGCGIVLAVYPAG